MQEKPHARIRAPAPSGMPPPHQPAPNARKPCHSKRPKAPHDVHLHAPHTREAARAHSGPRAVTHAAPASARPSAHKPRHSNAHIGASRPKAPHNVHVHAPHAREAARAHSGPPAVMDAAPASARPQRAQTTPQQRAHRRFTTQSTPRRVPARPACKRSRTRASGPARRHACHPVSARPQLAPTTPQQRAHRRFTTQSTPQCACTRPACKKSCTCAFGPAHRHACRPRISPPPTRANHATATRTSALHDPKHPTTCTYTPRMQDKPHARIRACAPSGMPPRISPPPTRANHATATRTSALHDPKYPVTCAHTPRMQERPHARIWARARAPWRGPRQNPAAGATNGARLSQRRRTIGDVGAEVGANAGPCTFFF
ncbi:hypothetical protein B0H13DRAFT_2336570 [Mycena leptocephala]|nr:hypothetical protein B0H13DRAFT_2336570 [Mycena leptocephala]